MTCPNCKCEMHMTVCPTCYAKLQEIRKKVHDLEKREMAEFFAKPVTQEGLPR